MTTSTFAKKGSQRWLQVAVERAPELLNAPLRASMKLPADADIEWLSPIRAEKFVEYRDEYTFNNPRWQIPLPKLPLSEFWPARGPMWDGIARTKDRQFILVEAKAHIPEIVSPRSRATEPARGRIVKSMREVQEALAPKSMELVDWSGTFYQYTNRIAHLYFLREQNGVKAHLLNVYFYAAPDVASPPDRGHWEGAIQVVETYLGLGRHRMQKYMHKVFLDASVLATMCGKDD